MLAKAYLYSQNNIKFIGIGGVDNGETAYLKILAGATILQIYTGLVYNGPAMINKINNAVRRKGEYSRLNLEGAIFIGAMRQASPRTRPILAILLPIILPIASSGASSNAASMATASSGAEVPNASIVAPMTNELTFK